MNVDDPRCGRWLVQREVARDLEPPEERSHERHDRAVAGCARDAQVKLRVELQETILVLEHVAASEQRLLRVEGLLHARVVDFACVDGSELGDSRLDQATGLEDAGNLLEAKVGFRAQKFHRDVVRQDEDPACRPGAHGEHAGVDEHAHGLAQRRAADLHRRCEVAFGGQPVPGVEFAEADTLGDLLDRTLERATRTDGDKGDFHVCTLPTCAALVHPWYKSSP